MSTKPGEVEGEELDRELAGLLDVETFEPSPEFRAQALLSDPAVYERAARDEDSGQAIVAFVTLQGDLEGDERTVEGIRATVAERIGKFARPKRIIWSDDLPKTRSGKIMRRLLRDIAEGRELGDVTTLRDPTVTAQLAQRVKELQAQED
jgi:acetyl-CoA synthetase